MADGRQPLSRRPRVAEIRDRLDELIEEGRSLVSAVQTAHATLSDRKAHPDMIPEIQYQTWYTEATRVIRDILPERLAEFRALYDPSDGSTEVPKSRLSYGIRHFLSGYTRWTGGTETTGLRRPQLPYSAVALRKLEIQVAILEAARLPLDSVLADIRGIVQADLFDSELAAARHLHENGYVRAAGVLSGVVLESHLQTVCATHSVAYQKQKPTISDLSQYLRQSGIIDLPVERRIQALADIRNLCSHKDRRDPTHDEAEQLIDGVDNTIKTIH